ncbi:hypothetical protein BO78DRAFT_78161 [Aspergillus sclerotiicarbonarius CBS 121057]|uniref:Uncharacterized protein n=1 Tax=Aspergillus sclerotiicarbonarius (strain CBS 121057 / IBT 28362) TaxID=1448318 RepID=A0A319EDE0_ASPSB|nr:hypothetical protein BO78DRAFT_78161 [Aspergillus sclerotiicarbonarius CBS 121057]
MQKVMSSAASGCRIVTLDGSFVRGLESSRDQRGRRRDMIRRQKYFHSPGRCRCQAVVAWTCFPPWSWRGSGCHSSIIYLGIYTIHRPPLISAVDPALSLSFTNPR